MSIRSVLTGFIALLLSASFAQAQRATIEGVISFNGSDPEPAPLTVSHDHDYCGSAVVSKHLLVKHGRVQDVVVYLEGVQPMDPGGARPLELSHEHCNITSPVRIADLGAGLTMHNGDAVTHTVTVQQGGKEITQLVLDPGSSRITATVLATPGLVIVGCTLHKWIYSFVWVFDHPFYAVSKPNGSFEIPFIVPGTYRLTAWHAELGSQTKEVVVGPDQVLNVSFSFGAPSAESRNALNR